MHYLLTDDVRDGDVHVVIVLVFLMPACGLRSLLLLISEELRRRS